MATFSRKTLRSKGLRGQRLRSAEPAGKEETVLKAFGIHDRKTEEAEQRGGGATRKLTRYFLRPGGGN